MYKKSVIHVIILAAGSGTRMRKKKFKQFFTTEWNAFSYA